MSIATAGGITLIEAATQTAKEAGLHENLHRCAPRSRPTGSNTVAISRALPGDLSAVDRGHQPPGHSRPARRQAPLRAVFSRGNPRESRHWPEHRNANREVPAESRPAAVAAGSTTRRPAAYGPTWRSSWPNRPGRLCFSITYRFSSSQRLTMVSPPGVRARSFSAITPRSETVAFFSFRANRETFFLRCRRRRSSRLRSLQLTRGSLFLRSGPSLCQNGRRGSSPRERKRGQVQFAGTAPGLLPQIGPVPFFGPAGVNARWKTPGPRSSGSPLPAAGLGW